MKLINYDDNNNNFLTHDYRVGNSIHVRVKGIYGESQYTDLVQNVLKKASRT